MVIEHIGNVQCHFQGLKQISLLFLCCFGVSLAPPSWGQTQVPPTTSAPEVADPLTNSLFLAMEGLAKRFDVAFVAEGRPFPQVPSESAPVFAGEVAPQANVEVNSRPVSLTPEELEVQKVAARSDYTAVHQGKVYLLTKRYTNPEDMPDAALSHQRTQRFRQPCDAPRRF